MPNFQSYLTVSLTSSSILSTVHIRQPKNTWYSLDVPHIKSFMMRRLPGGISMRESRFQRRPLRQLQNFRGFVSMEAAQSRGCYIFSFSSFRLMLTSSPVVGFRSPDDVRCLHSTDPLKCPLLQPLFVLFVCVSRSFRFHLRVIAIRRRSWTPAGLHPEIPMTDDARTWSLRIRITTTS
jgi:hypothetical protein